MEKRENKLHFSQLFFLRYEIFGFTKENVKKSEKNYNFPIFFLRCEKYMVFANKKDCFFIPRSPNPQKRGQLWIF